MIKLPEGGYEIIDSASAGAETAPVDRFSGKVYFLADATNASAASELLARVRLNKMGTIIGEQTAGNQQGSTSVPSSYDCPHPESRSTFQLLRRFPSRKSQTEEFRLTSKSK